jgi:hypothetical protein
MRWKTRSFKPLIITALDTTMRRGELIKLQWDYVNFANRIITVIALNSKTARAPTNLHELFSFGFDGICRE